MIILKKVPPGGSKILHPPLNRAGLKNFSGGDILEDFLGVGIAWTPHLLTLYPKFVVTPPMI